MVSDQVHLSHFTLETEKKVALHCGIPRVCCCSLVIECSMHTQNSPPLHTVREVWAQPDSWCHRCLGTFCMMYILFAVLHYPWTCKIYCKPWCTLFSSLRNCFLAPGSERTSITGGQDAARNCNGQSSRRKEYWTSQEEPEKSSISTEEPEEPHRLSSPRGP